MTKLEQKALNLIENSYNFMKVFNRDYDERDFHNGFSLLIEPDQISLIDTDIVVAVFNRGYVQFTQIIPLICQIVEVWGEKDRNIEIH